MGLDFPCGIATMHISGGGDCELLHIMLILYLLFSMVASTEAQISLECSSLEAVPSYENQSCCFYCPPIQIHSLQG
jgi:hypothetical protein